MYFFVQLFNLSKIKQLGKIYGLEMDYKDIGYDFTLT